VRPRVVLGPREVAVVVAFHDSADSIEATVRSLPPGHTVYCVANNCRDATADVVRALQRERPEVRLIDVDYPAKSKSKAALLGALQAQRDGFGHVLLIDDDVLWPPGRGIEVIDPATPVTALPVVPAFPSTLLQSFQVFEYVGTNLNKRCQTFFARDVTWAAGAAAIYRTDVYLEVMRQHDGEFAGEDVQCSYLHHLLGHRIDFVTDTIVATDVPRTPSAWWRQRAHCWDVSFMFLHLGLLLRVIFRPLGQAPGGWIRLLTFYRIYDSLLVLVKLALPLALLRVPSVSLLFLATTYLIVGIQILSYPMFFAPLREQWGGVRDPRRPLALTLYPAYLFVTWLSRMAAVPKVIRLKLNPRPLLAGFIDKGYAACMRVEFSPKGDARPAQTGD
jgi:cellulose synthase/poly-beta-1,6-N-acetylglucosamine synthase-like glycosyltransferase